LYDEQVVHEEGETTRWIMREGRKWKDYGWWWKGRRVDMKKKCNFTKTETYFRIMESINEEIDISGDINENIHTHKENSANHA